MIPTLLTFFILTAPITEVTFTGNNSISSKILAQEILSKKGDEYNEVNINFDSERLERYYRTQGFFQSDITSDVRIDDEGVLISFSVTEGPRPIVKRIMIKGSDDPKVEKLLALKFKDFFISAKIKQSEVNIRNYYKDRGFAYVDVTSLITIDSGLVTFSIKTGKKYYIRNITCEGLRHCREEVLFREMEVAKGDHFSKSKLAKSQRNIYALGFFSTINIDLVPAEPDSIDLQLTVRELKSRILNFGIGFSIPVGFLFSFAIEELNLWNRGHRFQIRPSFKINIDQEWETKLEGRYIIPHVTPWRLTFTVLPFWWYEKTIEYTRHTRGGELRISKLITDNLIATIANQYKYVDLQLVSPGEISDTLRGVTNSMKLQLMIDYRDDFFNPKKGYYSLPMIEYAGGFFGGVNNFVRFEIDNRHFMPLLWNTLAHKLRIGVMVPTNGLAFYEEYYIGGQYSLRGYPEKSIGPDAIGEERYGRVLVNYNLEYRIHLPWNFGCVGFFDLGCVDNSLELGNSPFWKAGFGGGLRYYTPIGPIRCDIGFPLNAEEMKPVLHAGIYHIY